MTFHLTFRRKENQNSPSNYDVKFNFEFNSNLEKKVRSVTLFNRDMNQKFTIPWAIFSYYTKKEPKYPFIAGSGLKLWFKGEDKNLVITDSKMFNLMMAKDQVEKILREAKKAEKGFSRAVEDTLSEFITNQI